MARIVHVCSAAEFAQYLSELLPHLMAQGHDVHFVSSDGPEAQALLGDRGITTHVVPIARGIGPGADVPALAALIRLFARLKPDLVHAHTPKGGLLGMLAARTAQVPARVYQLHGLRYETATGLRRTLLMNSDRLAARLAHQVVCVSPSVQNLAIADAIVNASKTRVLAAGSAQGIDPNLYRKSDYQKEAQALRTRLAIPAEAPCVIYLGRLAKDKGLLTLKDAWAALRRDHDDAHLILAGSHEPTDPIDPSTFENVEAVHLIDHMDDPRPLLAAASVLVLPSHREGLPQSILEAGAMGIPVVATKVTGIVDAVLPNHTGLLVPAGDSGALADALRQLLTDPVRRAEMGSAADTHIRARFAPGPIFTATRELYEELL